MISTLKATEARFAVKFLFCFAAEILQQVEGWLKVLCFTIQPPQLLPSTYVL